MPRYNQQIGFPPFPPIVKNLIIINFLIWIAESFVSPHVTDFFMNTFALHSMYSDYFKPWQIFTYMFLHSPFDGSIGDMGVMHILLNMLGLWMFGSQLEIILGQKRFLLFYLACGLGAGIIYTAYLHFDLKEYVDLYRNIKYRPDVSNDLVAKAKEVVDQTIIGASGAIYGILAAFGYLFPNSYLLIYFIIPLKAKWAVIGMLAYELYSVIFPSVGDDVGHVAHLGGALVGFLLIYFWNKKDRTHFY
ncbi:MAG: rhomboid family intramembrane serine protease [Arachidicoccus sp.]|nr:rhomboid family intramembrane serine protease [Arachidicoccus sp.]